MAGESVKIQSILAVSPSDRALYVHKRVERAVAGIYLATRHLKDTEPLKTTLREKSMLLLGLVMPLVHGKTAGTASIRELLFEIVSFLEVGMFAGTITEGNARMLQEVCVNTASSLSSDESGFGLGKEFFKTPEKETGQGKPPPKARKSVNRRATVQETRERREKVYAFIRSKGRATAQDILRAVKTVSDKTIQRDLAALIKEGRVERIGRKRWTAYAVKTTQI